jgi:DNA repair protein RecN (Recombination protein N)
MLVDLHQQFDTLELGDSGFQRDVMDALAAHGELLHQYHTVFLQLQHTKKEMDEMIRQKDQFNKEYDYNKFLFDELDEAKFHPEELEEADAELKLLSNSEGIKAALSKVSYGLQEGEEPMVSHLKSLCNQLQSFSEYHAGLPDVLQRMQSAQIELQDIADEVDRINDHVQYDPRRIEEISERIALGYKLFKKHGVKTTAELLSIRRSLEEKLQAVMNMDEAIASKEKVLSQLRAETAEQAKTISANRKKQVKPFENKVNELLIQVGMPNARIRVEINQTESPGEYGADEIGFLFDANKSNRFEPVGKVASGGELSRLMLCIKSLVAQSLDLPTLIFDEIDTGISGEAAKQVGIIMKGLAKKRQVISITHQPQIAGKADAHFFVYKQIKGDTIKTNIRLLSKEERITTIAQMLSGEKPTAAAIENAREMLMN